MQCVKGFREEAFRLGGHAGRPAPFAHLPETQGFPVLQGELT